MTWNTAKFRESNPDCAHWSDAEIAETLTHKVNVIRTGLRELGELGERFLDDPTGPAAAEVAAVRAQMRANRQAAALQQAA